MRRYPVEARSSHGGDKLGGHRCVIGSSHLCDRTATKPAVYYSQARTQANVKLCAWHLDGF